MDYPACFDTKDCITLISASLHNNNNNDNNNNNKSWEKQSTIVAAQNQAICTNYFKINFEGRN